MADKQKAAMRWGVEDPHRPKIYLEMEHSEDFWCYFMASNLYTSDPRFRCHNAEKAFQQELGHLRSRGTWDEKNVREYVEACAAYPEARFAVIFPLVGIEGHGGPEAEWL